MDRRQEKRPSRNLDENYDELERLRKQVESAEKRAKRPLRKTSSSSTDASQDGCGSSGDPGAEPIRRLCRNELRRRYKAGCNAPDPPLFNRILALQILFRGMLRKLEYQPCIPPGGTWFHEIKHDGYRLLVQREGWRMSELAEALRVDPSTATRAVQGLLRTGLAERRPYRGDGRVVMVSATTTGCQRYDAIARCRRAFMERVLRSFSGDERLQLASLLERLVAAADDVAGTTRN